MENSENFSNESYTFDVIFSLEILLLMLFCEKTTRNFVSWFSVSRNARIEKNGFSSKFRVVVFHNHTNFFYNHTKFGVIIFIITQDFRFLKSCVIIKIIKRNFV